MTERWKLTRGANVLGDGTRFSVWAPQASRVSVLVEGGGEHELELHDGGEFRAHVRGVGAGVDYRFRLDGKDAYPDPVSRHQPGGVHGASRIVDPSAFRWTDDAWTGRDMADMVIYELHVGTFTSEGTFAGVVRHLRDLASLGITAIEIMPVAQFPGARNWGYDGVQLYAPHADYGGPEELRRLVNAAHAAGIAVILDVVYNHVGPEGNYLGAFGPYFTETYRTPWGKAVNYDDAGSDEVRRFVIDNALHWVTEYRIDGLRLDAVHGIYDFGARHVLRELADAVHAEGERLGRRIVAIAESDLNDPRVVRADACGHALDAQWSDDLHHSIHARLTGERRGYYRDFGETAQIAKALRERFVYDGRYSAHRRRRHGAPALDVPADRFVVAIQNHDQVGNRANGDRLSALVPFEARTLAAALYLLSPYVPMLWMGEEYDETNPFLYFVSHSDEELLEAVRKGRREEFKAFGWGESVPDPAAVETFERSKLDRSRADTAEGKAMLALYGELLRLRRGEALLRPGGGDVAVDHDEPGGWIRVTLQPRGRGAPPNNEGTPAPGGDHHPFTALSILFNLSSEPRAIPLATGPRRPSRATRLLGTDDALFRPGAATRRDHDPVTIPAANVVVPPLTAAIFRLEHS